MTGVSDGAIDIPWLAFAEEQAALGSSAAMIAAEVARRGGQCGISADRDTARQVGRNRAVTLRVAIVHALVEAGIVPASSSECWRVDESSGSSSPEKDLLVELCARQKVPPGLSLRSYSVGRDDSDYGVAARAATSPTNSWNPWTSQLSRYPVASPKIKNCPQLPEGQLEQIRRTIGSWERELGVSLLGDEEDFPNAWNAAIAITALEHLWKDERSLEKVAFRLLTDTGGFTKFCGAKSGELGCIPTGRLDGKAGLSVTLHCAHWLASLLDHGRERQTKAFWSLDFRTAHMGERKNGEKTSYTGLKVAHLYNAVLVERLYLLRPRLPKSPTMTPTPPEELPKELETQLPPGRWESALAAVRDAMDTDGGGQRKADTRYAGAAPDDPVRRTFQSISRREVPGLRLLSREVLQLQRPSIPGSLGSVVLDPLQLDRSGNLLWMVCTILVRHQGQWRAIFVESVEQGGDHPDRVELCIDDRIPDGLDQDDLQDCLGLARWAVHVDGRGAFISAALDLDYWR